ncbi:MAG: TerB family tellurite resistance protein [Tunicatimonas sp.]|uniref:TerB family tellurite resistance protein n=1 Tax=Tunicatimonas sp. TaxID=1940096 RepID=UPI003C78279C
MGIWDAFFNRQNRNSEREYINQLFRVAYADGSLDKIEVAYIYAIGKKLGMTKEELAEARENFNSATLVYKPPRDREQRFFMLFYLINLIRADDEIHPEEMRITENIVMKLGYSPDTVDTILSTIETNQNQGISPEETYTNLTEQLG